MDQSIHPYRESVDVRAKCIYTYLTRGESPDKCSLQCRFLNTRYIINIYSMTIKLIVPLRTKHTLPHRSAKAPKRDRPHILTEIDCLCNPTKDNVDFHLDHVS